MKKSKVRKDTRHAILEAAVELFAIRGFDGTGVRAIVNNAGTALCSVNYHFKNKEELYDECIRYIIREKLNLHDSAEAIDNCTSDDPQDISNALYEMIRNAFHLFFRADHPNWYGVLLTRAAHEKHPVAEKVKEFVTAPRRAKEFLLEKIPGLTEEEAFLWVFSFTGQLQNFIISKNTILEAFQIEDYTDAFIEKIVNYSAENLIKSLNLPKPVYL